MNECQIPVNGSDQPGLVSPEDYALASQYLWHMDFRPRNEDGSRTPRRVRTNTVDADGNRKMISLHQLVMGFPGKIVDHHNRNVLDNRRENLRLANHQGNRANSKPTGARRFKGTTKERNRWTSCIYVNGKRVYLGTHDTEELAAAAYDRAAVTYFGKFAGLNFPVSEPVSET